MSTSKTIWFFSYKNKTFSSMALPQGDKDQYDPTHCTQVLMTLNWSWKHIFLIYKNSYANYIVLTTFGNVAVHFMCFNQGKSYYLSNVNRWLVISKSGECYFLYKCKQWLVISWTDLEIRYNGEWCLVSKPKGRPISTRKLGFSLEGVPDNRIWGVCDSVEQITDKCDNSLCKN
jgi:hypothetical protein